jgi:formate hydrogenlyase transcriptional activator
LIHQQKNIKMTGMSDISEQEILLSLTNDITAVRDKKDILKLINPKLKTLFDTDDIFICSLDASNETLDPVLRMGGATRIKHQDYSGIVNSRFPIHDGFIDTILGSDEPLIVDICKFPDPPPYMTLSTATGLTESLSVALHNAGEVIGILTLWSENKNHFTSHHKRLISDIASPIAIVVTNITANDEIEKREAEKTILLSLSNEIAAVRRRDDLFEIVNARFKTLFSIEEFGIAQINRDRTTYSAFILELQDNLKNHPDFKNITEVKYNITDPVFSGIMNSEEPVIFDVNELAQAPGIPAYVGLWKTVGLRRVLGTALRVGGKNVGCAFLHIDKNPSFNTKSSLLKGVCAQLSMKVANILAYEEIEKEEKEKSILLALSNAIAAMRNRNDFFDVVISQLKKIFTFDGFAITYIHEDGKTYGVFNVDRQYNLQNIQGYKNLMAERLPVTDPNYSVIIHSEDPVLFKIDEMPRDDNPLTMSSFARRKGIKQVLSVPLRVGGKTIGAASFHFFDTLNIEPTSNLLKSVCAQLALAVSNIMANEEIVKREEEKTILLSLSTEIASLKNRSDLFQVVNGRIKEIFSITQFGIVKINEDRTTHSAFMMDLGAFVTDQKDFTAITNLKYKITDKAFSRVMASDDPVILDVNELAEEPDPPEYVRFWKEVGFQKLLCLALKAGGNNIGAIFLNIDPASLNDVKTNLLKGICAQLSVAVSNILANEKVLDQLNEINKYKQQLEQEKTYLKEEIETSQNYTEIIGDSPELKKVFRLISQVAYSDSTVLLLGETGTGKELIARAIHNASPRKSKLMVKVNCAALPVNLIESELFGHERGSFTGALERRIGKFELANNGTLFLDEIGEMSLDLQVKLLRALQEKEIERIGGKTTIKIDARIIAATNRDLEKLMAEGKFRSDLYYRLNIFPIVLPSLRDRREDIPRLASYFTMRYSKKAGKRINTIHNKALQELMQYNWPGNIRELEHLVERSVLLATGDAITEIHLPRQNVYLGNTTDKEDIPIKTIDENEKEYILKVLKYVKGRIGGPGGAAELLGLPTSTLNSRIKRLGIRKEHLG